MKQMPPKSLAIKARVGSQYNPQLVTGEEPNQDTDKSTRLAISLSKMTSAG
jgi:hypothetical protein